MTPLSEDLKEMQLALEPLIALQQNVSEFFEKTLQKNAKLMSCREGCSACCYVDLQVFFVEAALILCWLLTMPYEQRSELLLRIEQSESREPGMGLDAGLQLRSKCVFLINGRCSIYPVRPIICRSQGAPLMLDDGSGDCCPKNFLGAQLPDAKEWLNLSRLNTLLAIAQKNFERKCVEHSDSILFTSLLNEVTNEQRVHLRKILSMVGVLAQN